MGKSIWEAEVRINMLLNHIMGNASSGGSGEGRGGERLLRHEEQQTGKASRSFRFFFPIPKNQCDRAPVQLQSETEMSLVRKR